ncbi:MAG TPA: hypothetical protein DCE56_38160 [Cyanobacteria bacterium UBA8553]|nr:hypothetical protein [Cyanobacteria bacterium UBA8553]HAJ61954.1 hypothetical protein [Cyanobacteria bacterium UBA8543]
MTEINFFNLNSYQEHCCTLKVENSFWQNILRFLFHLNSPYQGKSSKTHDYTRTIKKQEYVFEPIDQGRRGYMTGYGTELKIGDYLILQDGLYCYRYQIEEIDYYSSPEDMWIASLDRVKQLSY